VISYESVRLFAKVPGYLKKQNVDIGSRVHRDDVLAVIDIPELETQLKREQAAVDRAAAREKQMTARIESAKADQTAKAAGVKQADANLKSMGAWLKFRNLQLKRMQDLFALKSIDERLVEEAQEHATAAEESANAARAALETANAEVTASAARLQQAIADKAETEAETEVAKADQSKTKVLVDFATIKTPFDGVVTYRAFFPGDFIKAAAESAVQTPLLTVERTDKVRVVVQVPDRDVPLVKPGNRASVTIDALGKTIEGENVVVSRTAESEDSDTRLMRVEIDLDNKYGDISQGMYGQVLIWPTKAAQAVAPLSVPSSCLAAKSEDGKASLYVVRDGVARLIPVRIGADDGRRVAVLKVLQEREKLTDKDEVILHPTGGLRDGAAVDAAASPDDAPSSGGAP
jgi:RND family efflux transporter MFP subunit